MSRSIFLIFPHQLFYQQEHLTKLSQYDEVFLIENDLFFKQYKFHKQKLVFHRATMKAYQQFLFEHHSIKVNYIEAHKEASSVQVLLDEIQALYQEQKIIFTCFDPVDNWLEKYLRRAVNSSNELLLLASPMFLNTSESLQENFFKPSKKSFFQTTFYKQQRKEQNILIDKQGNPLGGKWTYDVDNRKKYPKNKTPPVVVFPDVTSFYSDALQYVNNAFPDCYGEVSKNPLYPVTRKQALDWLDQFLEHRFMDFGIYEDAIVKEELILNHSVISPLLNIGLISVQEVLDRTLLFFEKQSVPLNSCEGFVRQIIGWREFIRGMYISKGSQSRTMNFWGFSRKIPPSFYNGTTGILPVDQTIKKVLKTAYCHHIERLMVLGNFMLLCEFDPREVYRWFMELFIDAYDWVMVPNIYGMSQFADGGFFATKPYISGSNYIMKMSNYSKDPSWQVTWDALFWRFIDRHQDFFKSNPRLSMMYRIYHKMPSEKKVAHLQTAELFLAHL